MLHYVQRTAAAVVGVAMLMSLASGIRPAKGQDLVAQYDLLTGSSSVFVFRESRKKPQKRYGRSVRPRSEKRGNLRSVTSRLSTNALRRREARRSGTKKRSSKAAARIRLAKTLTAKAETWLENNETDKAIAAFRNAIKNDPKNSNARMGLSEALTIKAGEVAGDQLDPAGIPYLEEAVGLDPNNDVAYVKLGEIHDAGSRNAKAVENFEKALAINPGLYELHLELAVTYLGMGEIAKAAAAIQKALADPAAGAEVHDVHGVILYTQNKNEQAVAALNKAVAIDPNNAKIRYHRAQAYTRVGRTSDLRAEYQKVVEIDPKFVPAWFDLGVYHYNAGEYVKAIASYQEVIALDASNAEAHSNLASAYRQMERYADANAEYKSAAIGIKDDADMFSEWGYCLGKVSEWEKAIARLSTARELSPAAVDYTNIGWAYYNAAQQDAKNKKAADAVVKLELAKVALLRAIELNPAFDAAYLNLGATNIALGNFAAAVDALTTAVRLHGNWVFALNELGSAYRRLNELNAAVATFRQVVSLDENFGIGMYNLGEALYARGDREEAAKLHEKLKRNHPELAKRLEAIMAIPSKPPAQPPATGADAKPAPPPVKAAAMKRWFDLDTFTLIPRYRYVRVNSGSIIANQGQYLVGIRGRFKFDKAGRYTISAGSFTGNVFALGFNNTSFGTGDLQTNLYVKHLFFAAKPTKEFEIQFGGLAPNNGEGTEITGYDNDSYLTGERVLVRLPRSLYFDEISATNGFIGDLAQPSIFKRLHRLNESNFHQLLLRKQLSKRVAFSADYTFESGRDTLRQAIRFKPAKRYFFDTLLFEIYQRVSDRSGYGFHAFAEKAVSKKFTLNGGFARVDPPILNADRFPPGKRAYLSGIFKISPEFSIISILIQGLGHLPTPQTHRTRFEVLFSYNLLETLRRHRIL